MGSIVMLLDRLSELTALDWTLIGLGLVLFVFVFLALLDAGILQHIACGGIQRYFRRRALIERAIRELEASTISTFHRVTGPTTWSRGKGHAEITCSTYLTLSASTPATHILIKEYRRLGLQIWDFPVSAGL